MDDLTEMSVDMYESAGDRDLARLSPRNTNLTMCTEHNSPKELFHFATKMTLCSQCLIDK